MGIRISDTATEDRITDLISQVEQQKARIEELENENKRLKMDLYDTGFENGLRLAKEMIKEGKEIDV